MIKKFLYRIFCGFFLGLSVFAPGFSGSMIAIMMGIYKDLVRIAANPFKELRKNILFCLPLVIGAVISGVLFLIAFKFLFNTYERATYLLFIGLIIGNLPVIFSEIKKCGFQKRYLIGGIGAFAVALTICIFTMGIGEAAEINGITSSLTVFAFGGFIGGIAALIPGMSVSMILLVIGVYRQIIFAADAMLHLNFTYLIPFGIFAVCAVLGLVLTSRGIKFIFEKFPGFANAMIFGFMSGSLIGILIQSLQLQDANFNWLLGGIMFAIGLGTSMLFVVLGKTMNKEEAQ
jgi:putative membrane protein